MNQLTSSFFAPCTLQTHHGAALVVTTTAVLIGSDVVLQEDCVGYASYKYKRAALRLHCGKI